MEEDRFGIVIGKGVLVDGLIDPISTRRVGAGLKLGIQPNALLPKSQTFEYFLDEFAFVDQRYDPHLTLTVGAEREPSCGANL